MTDPTERAARALCKVDGCDPDTSLGGDKENWLWMEYITEAKAVLTTLEAGDSLDGDVGGRHVFRNDWVCEQYKAVAEEAAEAMREACAVAMEPYSTEFPDIIRKLKLPGE